MSLILDEGLVPVLGLSAPSHRYLPHTHARGFMANLAYGIAVGLTAEGVVGGVHEAPVPCLPPVIGVPAHSCEDNDMSRTQRLLIAGMLLASFFAALAAMQWAPIKTYEAIALQRIVG